jgi:sulfite reductase (ferredoxin)
VLDKPNGAQLKTFMSECVDHHGVNFILTPHQSVLVTDIKPEDKPAIEALMEKHRIKPIEQVDPLVRLAIACPALPLCGLAVGEAERYMPTMVERMSRLLHAMDLGGEEILMRMTGCPNGCARPYMAELAWIGDGKDSYQVYVGGSPVLTNVGFSYKERAKVKTMENVIEPLFAMWKEQRTGPGEAFGSFCSRVGLEKLEAFAATYECKHPCNNDLEMPAMVVRPMFKSDVNAERAR